MTTAYFPGCSLHGTAREFGESLLAVAGVLGRELRELEDWNCCGASSAHVISHRLAVALPARNLALAREQGCDELLAPCAACYNRLASARRAIAADPELAEELPDILGRPIAPDVAVRNVVQVLAESLPLLKSKVTAPLEPYKIACYYGCLLVRPREVAGTEDPEQPTAMEDVLKACGATPVRWNMATECCGGAFSVCRTGSVIRLGRAILDDARSAGATAIAVACPMCHSNLDMRQAAMNRAGEPALPIFYLTELVGLALGLSRSALGLDRHFVPVPVHSAEAH
jgi:heterodisulfide reductase subunit B2